MEIRLGIMVADVPYQPGDKCDNWGNFVSSRLGGRDMHILGISLWWEFLLRMAAWSVVTIYYCAKAMV